MCRTRLAATQNLFLVLWIVPELSRAWVPEGMPWSTGGGCLQPLTSLDRGVVVSFLCWAGGGWGKESILEDPMLKSLCIEIQAAAASLVFWYGQQILIIFKALRVAWQTF